MWEAVVSTFGALSAALDRLFSEPNAEDWIAFGGWIVAVATLTLALVSFQLQKVRERRVELQENYLRLELESNEVFRFEAAHGAILDRFKLSQAPDDYEVAWTHAPDDDDDARRRKDEARAAEESIADNFFLQQLNLFEIAARFRRDNVFAPQIFGSWVIWYHDVTRSWWFRRKWRTEYSDNYTADLYYIFTPMTDLFDEIAEKTYIPVDDNEAIAKALKRAFFMHVSALFHCPIVLEWLRREEIGNKPRFAYGLERLAFAIMMPFWKLGSLVRSWFTSPLSTGLSASAILRRSGVG